jgi:hypothetical protein
MSYIVRYYSANGSMYGAHLYSWHEFNLEATVHIKGWLQDGIVLWK